MGVLVYLMCAEVNLDQYLINQFREETGSNHKEILNDDVNTGAVATINPTFELA